MNKGKEKYELKEKRKWIKLSTQLFYERTQNQSCYETI